MSKKSAIREIMEAFREFERQWTLYDIGLNCNQPQTMDDLLVELESKYDVIERSKKTYPPLTYSVKTQIGDGDKQKILNSVFRFIEEYNIIDFSIEGDNYVKGKICIKTTEDKINEIFKIKPKFSVG